MPSANPAVIKPREERDPLPRKERRELQAIEGKEAAKYYAAEQKAGLENLARLRALRQAKEKLAI